TFARECLARVQPAFSRLTVLAEQALLLEKGLFLAAHFDLGQFVQEFVAAFHQLLGAQDAATAAQALEPVLGECSRGLRKLGMRDEISKLLERMAALVLRGQHVQGATALDFTAVKKGQEAGAWAKTLKLLLHVANGWFYFGQQDRARHILDEVR